MHRSETRTAGRLIRVSEHLEAVLGAIDLEEQEELAEDVIAALKAVDEAYERETGRLAGQTAQKPLRDSPSENEAVESTTGLLAYEHDPGITSGDPPRM